MFFKTTTGKVTGKTPQSSIIQSADVKCVCGCSKRAHFHAPATGGGEVVGKCVNHADCPVFRPAT